MQQTEKGRFMYIPRNPDLTASQSHEALDRVTSRSLQATAIATALDEERISKMIPRFEKAHPAKSAVDQHDAQREMAMPEKYRPRDRSLLMDSWMYTQLSYIPSDDKP